MNFCFQTLEVVWKEQRSVDKSKLENVPGPCSEHFFICNKEHSQWLSKASQCGSIVSLACLKDIIIQKKHIWLQCNQFEMLVQSISVWKLVVSCFCSSCWRIKTKEPLIWTHWKDSECQCVVKGTNNLWPHVCECSCGGIIMVDLFRGMCMLQQWEVAVVSRLDWCLASVVPSDFLEPILHALPFVRAPHLGHIRRRVHSYIALAATGRLRKFVTDTWGCWLQ